MRKGQGHNEAGPGLYCDRQTDGPTDGLMDEQSLLKNCVSATKKNEANNAKG